MRTKRQSNTKQTAQLKRALNKCSRMYANAVHAYCTPQEYLILCDYFEYKPKDLGYYKDLTSKGISRSGHKYIHVQEWKDTYPEFPINENADLKHRMVFDWFSH